MTALAREIDLVVDARKALTDKQIKPNSAWRNTTDSVAQRYAHAEATRLASAVLDADKLLSREQGTNVSIRRADGPSAGLRVRIRRSDHYIDPDRVLP